MAATATNLSTKATVADRFGRLPLSFEINQGQTAQAAKFLSRGPGYDLFLTANEAVLTLRKPQSPDAKVREGSVLRLKMIGANAAPEVEGQDELPGKVNYFFGDDPEKWRRNVPTYRKVYYKDVYPGIDVVYYGNQRELEYDFYCAAAPELSTSTINTGDTTGAPHLFASQCTADVASSSGADRLYRFVAPSNGNLHLFLQSDPLLTDQVYGAEPPTD